MPHPLPLILRVAVPIPLPRLFDYLPPAEAAAEPLPGMRVEVPFGGRLRVGMIVALATVSQQDPDRLKAVAALLDIRPLLRPPDLELILWAAEYYHQPPGEALFAAIPARLRRPEPQLDTGLPGWRLSQRGRSEPLECLSRAPRQARLASLLRRYPQGLTTLAIQRRLGDCSSALRGLRKRGWLDPCRQPAEAEAPAQPQGPPLNPQQIDAVDAARLAFGGFRAFLLQGVTGSGKTEVYIQLLLASLAAGRQALLLVPEIGLTPQLRRRLARRVGGRLAILHSGMTATERQLCWHQAANGEADLVLGTRSAVFVPLPRLGLILVDEEHDLSFKQQDGFRYSARDLAVRRAQRAGCPVLLGSATPSLESLHNAESGRYGLLELPQRAGRAQPPEITLLDIRGQPLRGGISPVLVELMQEQFAQHNQVLLFLNRRGFSPVLTCHECGWVAECPRCDARLTLHLSDNRLWCHHCGLSQPIPPACPACSGLDMRPLGLGTERLHGELNALFPDIPVARVDRDSTRGKGTLHQLLADARAGKYPLLVGTQMLAKGHHFPRVTLVGILDVDNGLYGSDFRAGERMAQLVIQVAGRAGRAHRRGRVILQTHHPDHPLLRTLRRHGYPAFAAAALRERREAELPPFSHQALVRAESAGRDISIGYLQAAAAAARPLADRTVSLLGPVPAPMERRAGRYRAQLLIQARRRADLQGFLADWIPRLYELKGRSQVRWSVDVDPQEMF
jgi:primosomal protein N' (replication factor Y)